MEEGEGGSNKKYKHVDLSCVKRFARYSEYPPGVKKKGEKFFDVHVEHLRTQTDTFFTTKQGW